MAQFQIIENVTLPSESLRAAVVILTIGPIILKEYSSDRSEDNSRDRDNRLRVPG